MKYSELLAVFCVRLNTLSLFSNQHDDANEMYAQITLSKSVAELDDVSVVNKMELMPSCVVDFIRRYRFFTF